MEVGLVDEVQKQLFLNKQNGKSLSTSKVVYARDEDPLDTVIIRNLYPQAKDYQKVLGLKDVVVIRNAFLSILQLIFSDLKILKKKIKYVRKDDDLIRL